jgi:hypothetical protein
MDKLKLIIPEKALWHLIVCTGIILFFILVGVLPLYRYNVFMNEDINRLQSQIKEQNNLNSTYAMLRQNLAKKVLRVLPNPAKTTISRQEAGKFQDVFRAVAEKSGLTTVSIIPELSSSTVPPDYLMHKAVVKGEFANFRKMLAGLGDVSYLEKIEEIHIQQHPDTLEFNMKILIALGK